jgi:hypothetical protein
MATILTNAGRTKLLAATPMAPVTLSHIAFGDGSGSIPSVIATRTALVNEVIRVDCTNPMRDTADLTVIKVSGSVPRTFGGVTIREVGLFDNTGVLIAYGSINNEVLPVPTDEYGYTYTGTMRVKLDNTSMVEVINSDAPAFDHRGLTFRDEPDAHPASAITTGAGRTVEAFITLTKNLTTGATLLVGEDNFIETNNTFTMPSTSGLAKGSKVVLKKRGDVTPVVQVNNTSTEQLYIGKIPAEMEEYDSLLYNISSGLTFVWNGTNRWEQQ